MRADMRWVCAMHGLKALTEADILTRRMALSLRAIGHAVGNGGCRGSMGALTGIAGTLLGQK